MTVIDTSTVDVSTSGPRRPQRSSGLAGGLGLLVSRRLWRDKWLLLSSAAVIGLATLIAYAGPQLVLDTIDDGARDAVVAAGSAVDIEVTLPVGNSGADNVTSVRGLDPADLTATAEEMPSYLPTAVQAQVTGASSWAVSSQIPLAWSVSADEIADAADDDRAADTTERTGDFLKFAFADEAQVELVEGELPADATGDEQEVDGPFDGVGIQSGLGSNGEPVYVQPEIIEIGLTPQVAQTLDLEIGDVVAIEDPSGIQVLLRLTGLVQAVDPEAPIWDAVPEAHVPTVADNPSLALFRRGTALVSAATLDEISSTLLSPFEGTVSMAVTADGLTMETGRVVASQMRDLASRPDDLAPEANVSLEMSSDLGAALEAYPARARAALAQMSVVVAGVIAVAAVVIALMARLLVSRREGDIMLERARGASVPSVALRLVCESLLFTAVGLAAGFAGARAFSRLIEFSNTSAFLVVAVGVVASPLLGAAVARRSWTGRREPANRQDRAKKQKARRARRITLEALALVLGALAVVTLRGRGVLQTQTSGIDPFLAAAPVLVALAAVVIVLRLYPLPMAIIQFFARRTKGVAGVITLAKARERIPALPLLALTLAIAVAVSGGLLVGTVRSGQEQASWERVGGQVRVDMELDDTTVAVIEQEGVQVSQVYSREQTQFALGSEYLDMHFMAVDQDYADALAAADIEDPTELRQLSELAASRGPGEPIPVLASEELLEYDFGDERSEVYVGREWVPVEIVGLATVVPEGWADGPFVMAPLEQFQELEYDRAWAPQIAFVTGPGAEDVVDGVASIPDSAVMTRDDWVTSVRESALIGGVETMMSIAVLTVGALAAVALLVTVLQGVRERGRALSMLRTQGMGAGWGWWLALAELGPLTVAAVVGGAGAGLAVLLLLGGTLGLEILAGGIAPPPLVASPEFLAAVAGGVAVLLLAAVTAEVLAHRRNRLSDVLRYGESR